ncbi:MAG: GAF domain-containing protein, partial [Gammaproteobacteria bacterium]|nr:GAF domain-containing protein [Gammaproteobacteria bacterium]NIT64276.1 GAF domain-containing protein [Gammaproteobacteria bacterium]NIV21207.1 guanylate cyclase [Gammaproteobacteria bacterium]NIY32856.1 guanylate cyclase [Gammaproteobacteria bacterium]
TLDPQTEWVQFVEECEEAALLLEPQPGPFMGLLLHPDMHSGIALPIYTQAAKLGLLVLNARAPLFYNRERFQFLDSFAKLAGGLLHNARLFRELKEYLARIEA